MNLDELRAVQNKERQTDSLQHLRESFYADVSEYVSELQARRDEAAEGADDPFAAPDVRRLTDEIETAKEVAEAVYERRLGKLVKRASLAAADMPADEEGLTAEEQELFEDLVDRIESNKTLVLDVVEGGGSADLPTGSTGDVADRETVVDDEAAHVAGPDDDALAADAMGGGAASDQAADAAGDEAGTDEAGDGAPHREVPPEEAAAVVDEGVDDDPDPDDRVADGAGVDGRTTVRITRDVGEIFAVDDREYDLSAEDVVKLPEENAEPLLQRDAAERVE